MTISSNWFFRPDAEGVGTWKWECPWVFGAGIRFTSDRQQGSSSLSPTLRASASNLWEEAYEDHHFIL